MTIHAQRVKTLILIVAALTLLACVQPYNGYPPQPQASTTTQKEYPPMPKWLEELYEKEHAAKNSCPAVNVTVDVPKDICKGLKQETIKKEACPTPSLTRLQAMSAWEPSEKDSPAETLRKALAWKQQASDLIGKAAKEKTSCL